MVMHPADLAMQFTLKLKTEIMGAVVGTNIDTKSNIKLVEKLFKENNRDGRFLFDVKDFSDTLSLAGMAMWKGVNSGVPILRMINRVEDLQAYGFEFNGYPQAEKLLFGRTGVHEQAEKEYRERIEELKKQKDDPDAAEELQLLELGSPGYYWLSRHPGCFNIKSFLKKAPNGQFLFGEEYMKNGRTYFNGPNVEGMKRLLDEKRVKPLSKEELDAYEKSLKDRDMPKYILESDPYGIGLYRNHMDALVEKDKDGKPLYEKSGELKVKYIVNMPEIDSVTGLEKKEES